LTFPAFSAFRLGWPGFATFEDLTSSPTHLAHSGKLLQTLK
jgi:hypothetical protein